MIGRLRALLGRRDEGAEQVFTDIYRRNVWQDPASRSGIGSSMEQTSGLRAELPVLLARHGVRTMVDAPCGDFHWMQHVDLPVDQYIGVDIVADIVARNATAHSGPTRSFVQCDFTRDSLPAADLILCRDCLVHLSFADITRALTMFKASGATWLLTTTFPDRDANRDINTGQWRPLNLQAAPFSFPAPVDSINEGCTQDGGAFADKSLALWRLDDLSIP